MISSSKVHIYKVHIQLNYYGSRAWANYILKLGIAECQNHEREPSSRRQEIFYYLDVLLNAGWEWQAKILRHWINRYADSLQLSKRADPIDEVGGLST